MSATSFISNLFNFPQFGDALPGVPEPGDLLAPEPENPEDYLLPGTLVRVDGSKLALIADRRATPTGVVYRLHVLVQGRDGLLYLSYWYITRPAYLIEDWWLLPEKASAPSTDFSALSA